MLPKHSRSSVAAQLLELIQVGAILIENSRLAELDEEYSDHWEWDLISGAFHFGMKDTPFVSNEKAVQLQEERAKVNPSPPLFETNESYSTLSHLPWPAVEDPHLALMRRRRTHRTFAPTPITQEQLSDCLYSGMGIVGILENPKICDLPLKMTPSGGARNPYEAYVYCLNVHGLQKGIYHYSAIDNTLGHHNSIDLPNPGEIIGHQKWTDGAAAIVFLVARFERTMWKYPDSGAYRVVLIEAGHIGQNIALTATSHDLVGNPTSAINDSIAERVLKISSLTHAAISAIALGVPDFSGEA